MDRERLDNWCEKSILGLILAILVFGPIATGAVRPLEMLVIQGLTMGVAALWIARFWLRPNYRLLWPPICWLVLAFTGYAIIRYQQAELEYVARGELLKIVIYAFLFFAILNNLHRQESTQLIAFVVIFLGMAISIYAIYQFFTKSAFVWGIWLFEKPPQYLGRGSGTFICPNNFAGFLEMIVPLGLALTLAGRSKPTIKVFVGYASVVMLVGIGVSLSRGGWIATGAALLVLFVILVLSRNSRLPAVVFLALLVGAGLFFFKHTYQPQKRWQQMFRESGNVDDIRFHLWKPAVQIWQNHFWWGGGPAHFDYLFPSVRPEVVQMRPGRAHNDYLNTLADWGLVGAVLVASAWGLLYWGAFKTWKFVRRANDLAAKPSNRSALVLGAAVGLLAILFHSALDFNMHIPANAILAVALMAMLTGHLRFATERYWVTCGIGTRSALTALAFVGLVYLGQNGVTRAHEFVLLNRGEKLDASILNRMKNYSKAESAEEVNVELLLRLSSEIGEAMIQEIDVLKEAHAVEPTNFETTYKTGEVLRNLSRQGGKNHLRLATEALGWFELGMKLNPHDAYNYFRYGMCLHWLERRSEAAFYFKRAAELDPNSFYVVAHVGWHFFEIGDYTEAKRWFEKSRSLRLPDWRVNQIAESYLKLIERKLAEKASAL